MEDEEVISVVLKAPDRECTTDVCTSITVGEMRDIVAIEVRPLHSALRSIAHHGSIDKHPVRAPATNLPRAHPHGLGGPL